MSLNGFREILNRIQTRYPELKNRLKESEAVAFWETIVGPGIAKHTRVLKVEDQIFHIEVDHPAWKAEVHHRKAQILAKFAEQFPDLKINDLFLVEKRYSNNNRGKPAGFLKKPS
jgi:predicted nucleic acid-binding Zn ribbon protein